MSARIPPGFAEVWIQFTLTGDQQAMFTAIGVDLAVGIGADQATTNAISVAAIGALDTMVSSDYNIGPGHVIFGQDGGDVRIDSTGASSPGLSSASALPQNCSYLVRKLTGLGGRRNRGRMYIPGVPEGSVSSAGVVTGAYQATAQAAVTALRTDLIALAEVEAVVLFHDSAPFTPTPITAMEGKTTIATQRRRLRP